VQVDFMVVSSYGSSTTSSGSVKLKKDMSIDPRDRDVLIIEDLIDTGNTLEWIVAHLRTKGCASVRLCCLLDKVLDLKHTAFFSFNFLFFLSLFFFNPSEPTLLGALQLMACGPNSATSSPTWCSCSSTPTKIVST